MRSQQVHSRKVTRGNDVHKYEAVTLAAQYQSYFFIANPRTVDVTLLYLQFGSTHFVRLRILIRRPVHTLIVEPGFDRRFYDGEER
jgi:hypothetical protein